MWVCVGEVLVVVEEVVVVRALCVWFFGYPYRRFSVVRSKFVGTQKKTGCS